MSSRHPVEAQRTQMMSWRRPMHQSTHSMKAKPRQNRLMPWLQRRHRRTPRATLRLSLRALPRPQQVAVRAPQPQQVAVRAPQPQQVSVRAPQPQRVAVRAHPPVAARCQWPPMQISPPTPWLEVWHSRLQVGAMALHPLELQVPALALALTPALASPLLSPLEPRTHHHRCPRSLAPSLAGWGWQALAWAVAMALASPKLLQPLAHFHHNP